MKRKRIQRKAVLVTSQPLSDEVKSYIPKKLESKQDYKQVLKIRK